MGRLDDLYAAVLAEPEDDGPRLVYADALQAAGDPRGEFIAVQCELARLGAEQTRWAMWEVQEARNKPREHHGDAIVDAARVVALRERERGLLAAHGKAWAGGELSCRFRRGFISHLSLYSGRMGERADLFDAWPFLRSLAIPGGVHPKALATEGARKLHQLRIDLQSCEWFVDQLAQLDGVRELYLRGMRTETIERWLASPAIARLEALYYVGAFDLPHRVAQLVEAAPLRALCIDTQVHGDVFALARSPHAAKLEVLDISEVYTSSRLDAVAASPHLQNLRALIVTTLARETDLSALADGFDALELLVLSKNFVDFLPLFRGRGLARLAHLKVSCSRFDDAAFRALAASRVFPRLITLDASDNPLTDEGARALAAAASGSRLAVLDVRENQLTKRGCELLARAFPNTTVLTGKWPA